SNGVIASASNPPVSPFEKGGLRGIQDQFYPEPVEGLTSISKESILVISLPTPYYLLFFLCPLR
ncbi:hypothetical protein KAU34_02155, partial [candidate division WOR-3 bacterium]|nr:hypothetical protein [candidate division WOR-3 bacterium]